jgi:uncharacterized protein (TIGR03118 family)
MANGAASQGFPKVSREKTNKMKHESNKEMNTYLAPATWRRMLLLSAALATATCIPSVTKAERNEATSRYQQINLVSDIAGVAQVQDTNLVNAWGISYHPTFPFWISDNGTGKTTLYSVTNDASGSPHAATVPVVVSIPGRGSATGQVINNSTAFNSDIFLFASEDGTISGWRPDLGPAAEILATRPTAVYKGITLASVGTNTVLLAANFSEGTLDVYDAGANLLGQFSDRTAPPGYAPFNVQNLNGIVFVTFAKQDTEKQDDAPGRGRGLIDTFNLNTSKFYRFAAGSSAGGHVSAMNSPWGLAIAPSTFGQHASQLLVGNFGSGTIMTFDIEGHFRGLLQGTGECPVTIDGLWGLTFGAGGVSGVATDLYFTAGPNGEQHGLFGVIQPVNDNEGGDEDGRTTRRR